MRLHCSYHKSILLAQKQRLKRTCSVKLLRKCNYWKPSYKCLVFVLWTCYCSTSSVLYFKRCL